MQKYNDWERGLALGAFFGSFIGPTFMILLMGLILTYDVYGERAKFLISRGLDKYFQLPSGLSEKLLASIVSPEEETDGTGGTGGAVASGSGSVPVETPKIRPVVNRRPRLTRVLGSLAPND